MLAPVLSLKWEATEAIAIVVVLCGIENGSLIWPFLLAIKLGAQASIKLQSAKLV
jgi:hypothetical protein